MVRDEVIGEELVETLDSNAEAGRVSDECAECSGIFADQQSRANLDGVAQAFRDLGDPEAHVKILVQP